LIRMRGVKGWRLARRSGVGHTEENLWNEQDSPVSSTAFEAGRSLGLPSEHRRGALAFATLFALESLARALISTVISVQAYDLLQNNQRVSMLFTVIGIGGLAATLTIPVLVRLTARRWVYTGGIVLLMTAGALLATHTLAGQAAGMFFRLVGTACLNITLSLYILDHIRKQDLVKSEPLRLALSTASWGVGPYLGVYLYSRHGVWSPFVLSIVAAGLVLVVFWYLRLKEFIRPAQKAPPNPLRNIGRFIGQPRLRLAWVIAFGRSCFWSTFFIYVPLLMIGAGMGAEVGGLLISLGNMALVTAVFFGRLARRVGVRQVIAGAMAVLAVSSILAGLSGTAFPLLAAALLLVGAVAGAALDGVGGIPFLRAVRARERAEMAGVYRTFIDMSDLLPTMVFSVVLLFLPLGAVFVVLGSWLAVVACLSWLYLPKSL
jgi:MFS family permease